MTLQFMEMNSLPSPSSRLCRSTTPFVLLLLAACGGDDGKSRLPGREAMLRGTGACSLSALSTTGESLPVGVIEQIEVDSAGDVYVTDRLAPRVTVTRPDGEIVRTLGRDGEGPGEFREVTGVHVFSGDSLLVLDQRLGRITVFAPRSDHVAYVLRLPSATRHSYPAWVRKTSDGSLLVGYRQAFAAGDSRGRDADAREIVRLLHSGGSLGRDSLLVSPAQEPLLIRTPGSVAVAGDYPFGRRTINVLGPGDRIYHGWTGAPSVRVLALNGRTVAAWNLPLDPVPVTHDDIEKLVNGEAPSRSVAYRKALEEAAPRTWPLFAGLVADDLGQVWVRLVDRSDTATWVTFTSAGRPVCTTRLPSTVDLRVVRQQVAYGVETDESGATRVVAYRVRPVRAEGRVLTGRGNSTAER